MKELAENIGEAYEAACGGPYLDEDEIFNGDLQGDLKDAVGRVAHLQKFVERDLTGDEDYDLLKELERGYEGASKALDTFLRAKGDYMAQGQRYVPTKYGDIDIDELNAAADATQTICHQFNIIRSILDRNDPSIIEKVEQESEEYRSIAEASEELAEQGIKLDTEAVTEMMLNR
jgi:hypothetical protein